ncbi:MAG TPA: hypothetical protein VM537_21710 [Anaerolineae bacterium]|nr:hypothetical protein [Anaerolineae bacterium]
MIDPIGLHEKAVTGYRGSADPLIPVPRCKQCGEQLWDGFLTIHREGKNIWLRFCSPEHMVRYLTESGVTFLAADAVLEYIAEWREENERLWYEEEFTAMLEEDPWQTKG